MPTGKPDSRVARPLCLIVSRFMSSSIQYLNYYGNFTTHHIDIVPSYLRAALSYDPETNKRILLQTLLYSFILLMNI